ncbi:MAG TPA: two-component regulator propeller domain-containing protein, partial [Candidatus Krumholzibacterium sp.]|nr:two-component regulator propeller domain-containing protein [Candidatus Krumholzibacterium sp.]
VNVYTPRDGLPSAYMRSFSLDPSGTVWAAGRGGLSLYDGSGWTPVNMPGVSLSGYDVLSMRHDTEGNMFLGTDGGRMIAISRDAVREIDLPQSFPLVSVIDIVEHQGSLWFLSGSRIFRRDGEEFTEIALPDPWYDGALTAMAFDGAGSMWVTTRFGILRYNGNAWEVFDRRLGLPTEYFTWVSPGAGGEIWFGTFDSGILRLTGEGWIHYTELNGIPSGGIVDLVTDGGGNDWLLAESGRIAVAEGGQWQQVSIPFRGEAPAAAGPDSTGTLYHRIKYLSGAPEDASMGGERAGLCMGIDGEGNVLICRTDGIYRHSPEGWHLIELPYMGEGIRPVTIKGTRRGEIWLGTEGQGVFIRRTGDWLRLGPSSGLSDGFVTALGEDENGRVWCGTRHGGITVCNIRK